ncbi:type II toxin-antitoxin system prevent-host-death family antitoxin [Lysobacter sp. HA18]
MEHPSRLRPLLSIPQARARREYRSIVRRDLPHADVQVTRRGEPIAVLVSIARAAELEGVERELATLREDLSRRADPT